MKNNKLTRKLLLLFAFVTLFSCVEDSDYGIPDQATACVETSLTVNATIAEVKALYKGSIVQIEDDMVIEGYVVSNDQSGNFFKTLQFQDAIENPTEGFQIDLDVSDLYLLYPVGSRVLISVKDLYLDNYNGVLKLGGIYEQSSGSIAVGRLDAARWKNHVSGTCDEIKTITPTSTSVADITDAMINTLITVQNTQVDVANLCQTYAVEGVNTNINLIDCDENELLLRNSGYADFYNQLLPSGSGTITGVLGKFGSDYQLYIRDTDDVSMNDARCDGVDFTCSAPEANATIQDIKDLYVDDLVQISENLIFDATITANDSSGNLYKLIYIQDETGGIRLRINQTQLYLRNYKVGQKITVAAKDLYIDNSNGELHLGGLYNGNVGNIEASDVYKHVFLGDTNEAIAPSEIDLSALSDDHLGMLVKVNDVQFIDSGNFVEGNFSTNRSLSDCDANKIIVRTSNYATFAEQALPSGNGPIVGILSKYNSDYQLLIRTETDYADMTNTTCDIYANATPKTIAEVRAMHSGSNVTVDGNYVVTVTVTSDKSTGNIFSRNLYAQDSSAGILLRFTEDHNVEIDQEIKVAILGTTLETYNGLLQINNIPSGNIVTQTAGTAPAPVSVTLAEALTGDYESQLVTISGVQFKSGATYSGSNTLTDCTDELTVFVNSAATFSSQALPTQNGAITGVMSVFNSVQLYIRDANDVNFTADALNCGGGPGTGPVEGLYFSEYAEGSSNNKYLEIYNGSTETIDLTQYAYPSVSNAPTTVGQHEFWNEFEPGATIAPGEFYIIAHGSADPIILAKANETHTYLSNGDDGYALVYGTESSYEIVDTLGDFNGDPGSGWDVAGVTAATKDHTLVRKTSVTKGNPNWTASAGTSASDSEWIVKDNEDWSNLGIR